MDIIPIPAFKDNYIWLLVDAKTNKAWAVDPGDAEPVIQYLLPKKIQLAGILITHHHADHAGGVSDLLKKWNGIPVYGFSKKNVAEISHVVKEGDIVNCNALKLNVLEIPGHTLDHIAFYNEHILFCGDTLFSAGCGRVFEGTYDQMYQSLMKLAKLPATTQMYCGHEYTLQNLKFAEMVEPENHFIHEKIIAVQALRAHGTPSLPSLMMDEMKMNPFLRCEQSAVIKAAEKYAQGSLHAPEAVFKVLREWKNSF